MWRCCSVAVWQTGRSQVWCTAPAFDLPIPVCGSLSFAAAIHWEFHIINLHCNCPVQYIWHSLNSFTSIIHLWYNLIYKWSQTGVLSVGHPFWALFRHTIGLRLASGVLGPFPRPWSSILIYLDFSKYYKFYNSVHRWHLNICVENACISRQTGQNQGRVCVLGSYQ